MNALSVDYETQHTQNNGIKLPFYKLKYYV